MVKKIIPDTVYVATKRGKKRKYGFKDIGFCWVREQERAKSQHHHWALFLDGDVISQSSKINEMIKQAWERQEGNYHVPTIKRPVYFADSETITHEPSIVFHT